jgi:hypothetical protein
VSRHRATSKLDKLRSKQQELGKSSSYTVNPLSISKEVVFPKKRYGTYEEEEGAAEVATPIDFFDFFSVA